MDIIRNNSEQKISNKNGTVNIIGNSNTITIDNSNITLTINGNGNQFDIKNGRINVCINGGHNKLILTNSQAICGFNGNNNQVQNKQNSNITRQYDNGIGNQLGENQPFVRNSMSNFGNSPMNNFQYLFNQQQMPQQQYGFNMGQYSPFSQQLSPQSINMNMNRGGGGFFNNGGYMNRMSSNNNMQIRMPQNVIPQQQAQSGEDPMIPGLNEQDVNLLPRTKHVGKQSACSICLCDVEEGDEQTFLPCIHSFHWDCIKDWVLKSSKCPVCNYDLKQYLHK